MAVSRFKDVFDADVWKDRCIELEELKVVGAVFYTDGGFKRSYPTPNASWGIHSFFFTDEKPKRVSRYKTEYPTKEGYSIEPKARQQIVDSVKIFNASGLLRFNDATNNIAELLAVSLVMDLIINTELSRTLKHVRVFSDSEYVLNQININLSKWKANGWKRTNGGPIANLEYWKVVDEHMSALAELDIELEFEYREGHVDFGNIIADRACSLAITQGIEQDQFCDEDWYFLKDVKLDPMMLEQKYVHFPGLLEKYENYAFMYSLLDGTIPVSALGCRLEDISLSILEINDESIVDKLKIAHRECVKLEEAVKPTPMVVELKNLLSNGFSYFLENDVVGRLPLSEDINTVTLKDPTDDKTVVQIITPARNSFKLLDAYGLGVDVLKAFDADDKSFDIRQTDITDIVYKTVTKNDVAKKSLALLTEQSIKVPVNHMAGGLDGVDEATLSIGLELPRRRVLHNLVDLEPKISVLTWSNSDYSFRYGVLVETTSGRGFWFNPYINSNLLH